ncbi:hypothetical protein EG833_03950 [archaeon]|nr:hypothetical protein [archaeon]
MRKTLLTLVVLVVLSGCARHYYRVSEGGLDIFLKAPEAETVFFSSSLDGYVSLPADRADRTTWVVRMPQDREFRYFYIIDGAVTVPECACREYDEFGSENCIYIPGM